MPHRKRARPTGTTTVPELRAIAASPSTDPNFIGLRLTVEDGTTIILGANLEGLEEFVMELIGAASHLPARVPEANEQAPALAALAHHIEIARGRTPGEAAMSIYVGSMRLQFFVSVQALLAEAALLVQELRPQGKQRPH